MIDDGVDDELDDEPDDGVDDELDDEPDDVPWLARTRMVRVSILHTTVPSVRDT